MENNTLVLNYCLQLQNVYEGPVWYGESYLEKFRTITEKDAFTKPSENIHSIAEQVSHCIYWRKSLIHVLDGNGYIHTVENPENWRHNDQLKQEGWDHLKKELEKTQSNLLEKLRQLSDSDLEKEYKEGRALNYFVSGVIQHDVYHLGQIGVVNRIIKPII